MQRNGIFPGRYAPLTYYEDVLEASRNTLMARNAWEICHFFAHLYELYLHNGVVCCVKNRNPIELRYINLNL